MLRAFSMGLSPELTESARIDGAGDLRILLTIVLPLSRAVLAVIALFYAVGYWSAWFNASIHLSDQEMMPLQNVLIQLVQEEHGGADGSSSRRSTPAGSSALGLQMAVVVLALIPCRRRLPVRPTALQEGHAHGRHRGVTPRNRAGEDAMTGPAITDDAIAGPAAHCALPPGCPPPDRPVLPVIDRLTGDHHVGYVRGAGAALRPPASCG